MANDDLQQRLDKGMYGTPLVNPEEQHKYMGTFRERCRLSMTVAEMKDAQNQKHLLEELAKHPEVTVLLNGEISSDLQSTYIKLLNQHGANFKIVNNFVENNPDSLGLLLAEKHAVDEPVIDVTEKYPQATETPKE
ncbi:MAG: YueI family protein, partial [Enterococcus faecalis]|nr:YueI family protein [Enterococcus faecalis]